jgi:glycosyltransferase involved in cell wall biosynthesis
MDSKTRVLLFVHDLSLTGAPRVIFDIFASLLDQIELHTIAPASGPMEPKFRELGPLDFLDYPAPSFVDRVKRKLGKQRLAADLEKWRPDIVYVNSVASLPMFDLMKIPNAPMIVHVHELHSHLYEYLGKDKEFLQVPGRYIGVSKPVCDLLRDELKIPAEKVSLIHECIPDDYGSGTPKKPNTSRSFTIGGAGSPSMRKGVTLWLEMAEQLRTLTSQPLRFVWVGMNRSYEDRLFREMARKLDLAVDFISVTPNPEVHYADFDVFAMTSLEDPCPLVVLENMTLGTPVLCFAESGGAPEEVGDTGIVIRRFSPTEMARSIARLIENPEERLALGRAAQQRVREQFTVSVQAPKILGAIQTLKRR